MTWSLIREFGKDRPRGTAAGSGLLSFPTHAVKGADGSCLITEELGIAKQVPFRFECRTLLLNATGKLTFDSRNLGIEDGFGCLVDGSSMALLRRTRWELLRLSFQGEVVQTLNLWQFSKRMPRYVSWTARRTFLVVFFNRSFDIDIIEIDEQGQLLWYLPSGACRIGIVGSAQQLAAGTILIADPFRHVAAELDREGRLVWQFGHFDDPSRNLRHLSSPSCAIEDDDGHRLIADTRNHRIVAIAPDGTSRPLELAGDQLCDPTGVSRTASGNLLICDTGNGRVLEVTEGGEAVWSYGACGSAERQLSYPRSVQCTERGRYLVADTAHDRVVEVIDERIVERAFAGDPPLFWPRCARSLPGGSLLVADARNGRIVEVDAAGRIRRQLSATGNQRDEPLCDPHDVRLLKNGHLLVTDSTRSAVVEVDWNGQVHSVIGQGPGVELKDPHSAQQLADGSVLIADTGHHRVVLVDRDGSCLKQLFHFSGAGQHARLHQPRYAEVGRDGTLVIADTGNNRVLGVTLEGELLWEFSHVPGSGEPFLNQPRWATLVDQREVVVCDHFHHRILHVRLTVESGDVPPSGSGVGPDETRPSDREW